jgi:hypothetical protein
VLRSTLKRRAANISSTRGCEQNHLDGHENSEDECAICMVSYADSLPPHLRSVSDDCVKQNFCGLGKNAVSLLNCGHVFHELCIGNFEKFTPFEVYLFFYFSVFV